MAASAARPATRKLTIVAQDPSVRVNGRILTADVTVPAEDLAPGPTGYRVKVVDYDASSDTLYKAKPFKPNPGDRDLLTNPAFHAQNVYAIAMRILARFEFALGRRISWGFDGHQIHIAPHAFADANAFYSETDRGLFFGYFAGRNGRPVFTCLSHDVVAHETTHAILDGLRDRYTEPSSPDQAAFHEAFADIVALLSVFALPDVVRQLLDRPYPGRRRGGGRFVDARFLKPNALKEWVLLGLAEEMGQELAEVRGGALRQSAKLKPSRTLLRTAEFQEPHRRGEILVAAVMNAFVSIWTRRIQLLGSFKGNTKDRSLVVEEGAKAADHLLTMAIRAIDYCPPIEITFADYLSALLTADGEMVREDPHGYRETLRACFREFGIDPSPLAQRDGTWTQFDGEIAYGGFHFESMQRDREEVFRFVWENRRRLDLDEKAYINIESIRPCVRISPDGFVLRETVVEYIQLSSLRADELRGELGVAAPRDMPGHQNVKLYGGGTLIFDQYGRLKFWIAKPFRNRRRQQDRLDHLWVTGFYARGDDPRTRFSQIHMRRAGGSPS